MAFSSAALSAAFCGAIACCGSAELPRYPWAHKAAQPAVSTRARARKPASSFFTVNLLGWDGVRDRAMLPVYRVGARLNALCGSGRVHYNTNLSAARLAQAGGN